MVIFLTMSANVSLNSKEGVGGSGLDGSNLPVGYLLSID